MTRTPDEKRQPRAPSAAEPVAEFASGIVDAVAEAAAEAAAFESFVSMLEPAHAMPETRDRVLSALRPEGRLHRFAPKVAKLLDVSVDVARALLDEAGDARAYAEGTFPGVSVRHVEGGPAVAGAMRGFVRIEAGCEFPRHGHLGPETLLVLQGTLLELESGRVYRSGQLAEARPGKVHTSVARPGPDLVYLALVFQGLDVGGTLVTPDDPRF